MKSQLEQVLNIVCDYYNVSPDNVKSSNREAKYVRARHVYFYLGYYVSEKTLMEIGNISNNNYTSVLHGKKTISIELTIYPQLKREINELKFKILSLKNKLIVEHVDLLQLSINTTPLTN